MRVSTGLARNNALCFDTHRPTCCSKELAVDTQRRTIACAILMRDRSSLYYCVPCL